MLGTGYVKMNITCFSLRNLLSCKLLIMVGHIFMEWKNLYKPIYVFIGFITYFSPESVYFSPPILLLLWSNHHLLSPWWVSFTWCFPSPLRALRPVFHSAAMSIFLKSKSDSASLWLRTFQHYCFREKEPNTQHSPAWSASAALFHHLMPGVSPTFPGLLSVLP